MLTRTEIPGIEFFRVENGRDLVDKKWIYLRANVIFKRLNVASEERTARQRPQKKTLLIIHG